MKIVILLCLAWLVCLNSKKVELIKDPLMQDLTFWYPEKMFCRSCSDIASVGPSTPNGLYVFKDDASIVSSHTYSFSTEVTLPVNIDSANFSLAVQVGGGGLYSLEINCQGFSWAWSSYELEHIATGQYVNISTLITFAPLTQTTEDSLKITLSSTPGQSDYISINEVHLVTDVTDDNMESVGWIILGILGFFVILGFGCGLAIIYQRRQQQFQLL